MLFYAIELGETCGFKWFSKRKLPVKLWPCLLQVLGTLWSAVGSRAWPRFVFLSKIRLYEVCYEFNGRSPESLTSSKLLLAT